MVFVCGLQFRKCARSNPGPGSLDSFAPVAFITATQPTNSKFEQPCHRSGTSAKTFGFMHLNIVSALSKGRCVIYPLLWRLRRICGHSMKVRSNKKKEMPNHVLHLTTQDPVHFGVRDRFQFAITASMTHECSRVVAQANIVAGTFPACRACVCASAFCVHTNSPCL